MNRLKIPTDYTITIKEKKSVSGVFGYHYRTKKLIELYPPSWLTEKFGIKKYLLDKILEHELGHAWGIDGCKKPWCLIFEAKMWNEKWKDIWWERVLMAFFVGFNRFDFCKEHKEYLKKYMR